MIRQMTVLMPQLSTVDVQPAGEPGHVANAQVDTTANQFSLPIPSDLLRSPSGEAGGGGPGITGSSMGMSSAKGSVRCS